jgi:hypothetical protein
MDEGFAAAESSNAATYFIDRHILEGRGGKTAVESDRETGARRENR